jgi:hypothetical protein
MRRVSPWLRRSKAAGFALLPLLIGAALSWVAPVGVEWLKSAGALLAVFPFGFFVLMAVIGISGVHGGSFATVLILPPAVNLCANFWLINRWLAKRESTSR